jgi:hypothetical protein
MPKLTDADLVKVTAIAPFEVALVIQHWSRQAAIEAGGRGCCDQTSPEHHQLMNGRGPPWALADETHDDFGRRMAEGIFTLLKEV